MGDPSLQDIVNSIPQRFRPEKAIGFRGTFHFEISGKADEDFTVEIQNDTCIFSKGLKGNASCVIRCAAKTYIDLELGKANPQMAFITGKLKVSNVNEMVKFSKLFRKYSVTSVDESELKKDRKPAKGPLKGLRVLDLTRLLPGPLTTMLMADMGAEVIKVEDPHDPDYIRSFPPFSGADSVYYLSLNRSKRSLAVNFRSEKGKKILLKLIKEVDIFIEQFRPGVLAHLGLGYETLSEINPKIIYVSITGYGQTGPYAQHPGHDLNYIGYSGLLGVTGNELGKAIPGGQVADVAGGSYMALNACLAALYARTNTGLGQHVDVSLLDCVMPVNTLQFAQYAGAETIHEQGEYPLSGGIANYNVYRCKDGLSVALGALEPKFWDAFCELASKPEWKPRILDREDEMVALRSEVKDLFLSKTRQEWLELDSKNNCCLSPVLSMEELESNPQILNREMIIETQTNDRSLKSIGIPLKFSDTSPEISWKAPELGEDTLPLLQSLSYSKQEIEALKKEGIIN